MKMAKSGLGLPHPQTEKENIQEHSVFPQTNIDTPPWLMKFKHC